ncbi:MAG: GerW family sporulation protein [Lachnospiraceae bacterium]
MAADNSFQTTVDSLFKGMDSFISAKTVVGDAIHIGDTIILPLVDVSFMVGAGALSDTAKKNNGGGGMGGKLNPCAVLVIQNGTTKLVNIKNQDGMTKILDMVPDIINKFTAGGTSSEEIHVTTEPVYEEKKEAPKQETETE